LRRQFGFSIFVHIEMIGEAERCQRYHDAANFLAGFT